MDKTIFNKKQIIKYILIVFSGLTFMVCSYAFLPNDKKQTAVNHPVVHIKAEHDHEIIVLIHGLMRTSMSMYFLKSYLQRQGYHVYSYSYPSMKYTIHEHSMHLLYYVEQLLKNNPGVKIHFITHSLGGIIIREALSKLPGKQLNNIGYLIMLAPPNQGSVLAKLSTKMFPMITSTIKPLAELSSDESAYVHRVPVPNIKMGIIAGRFDAKVPPSSAFLAGQTKPVVINTNHTFIMNNSETRKLILHFLEKGTFAKR